MAVTASLKRRAEQPADYTSGNLTLRRAVEIFTGTFSARWLAPLVLFAVVARLALGGWTWADLVVVGAILGLQPFTEWVTHVTLLHWRPRTVVGVRLDPLAARRHRAHHRDPKAIGLVLVPRQVLVATCAGAVGIFLVAAPSVRLAVTGLATSYAMYLLYEWTHFLIHSSYRPKSRYYRSIHRAHRLHHFRNEKFWFGVTINVADHILRTFPERESVPVSATARTLGVESAG